MKITLHCTLALAAFGAAAHAQDRIAGSPGTYGTEVVYPSEFDQTAYAPTEGEQLYATLCAGCHMPDGGGAEGAAEYPALRGNPLLEYAAYPVNLVVNGQAAMPSLGHLLDDEQVVAVVSYIQTHLGNDYEPDATAEMVSGVRPAEQRAQLREHQVEVAGETETDTGRIRAARGTCVMGDGAEAGGAAPEGGTADDGAAAQRGGVIRHPLPGSDFPILQAVEIPADATLVYLSGTVPEVVDETAAEGAPERFGDTAAQTVSTLDSIAAKLDALDLAMGDVVKMQVYLVAPEGAEGMDFAGFMEGYTRFFGTEDQPNLPTRSVFEVAGLTNPAWLVEIEVVAVRD
jgi:enamine deaminase RidA (YjgF/YER057c/UK114 family)/mono/diheme cytochrome c family protein